MNVHASVRDVRLPDDVAALRNIDTSYVTEAEFVIQRDDGTQIGLCAQQLERPARRGFDALARDLDREDRPWGEGFVATTSANDVVGFAAIGFEEWNRRLRIWHFYVTPAHRHRGIARQLYTEVKARGDRLEASHVFVETPSVNVPAIRAYQRLGLELVGFDASLYNATPAEGEIAVYLAQRLG